MGVFPGKDEMGPVMGTWWWFCTAESPTELSESGVAGVSGND